MIDFCGYSLAASIVFRGRFCFVVSKTGDFLRDLQKFQSSFFVIL
jgi:hypothetical protein